MVALVKEIMVAEAMRWYSRCGDGGGEMVVVAVLGEVDGDGGYDAVG